MKLKNFLVELLSNIIHDKLELLSDANKDIKKTEEYKKVEDLFSDVNNIVDVDDKDLRDVLSDITDEETINGIISNIDMIKIVVNGKNSGLDLSLDDAQNDLIKSVYDLVNNHRTDLENRNLETRQYLEDFISKCRGLSSEIGTGVVRDIDTLDEIFSSNDVSIDDIIKCKYEILKNNSKNYNMNLEGKVKEEVDLRILLKKINVEIGDYSDIEKQLLLNESDISSVSDLIDYIDSNKIKLSNEQLFFIMTFSNVGVFSNIIDLCHSYNFDLDNLFKIPGIFVSKEKSIDSILSDYKDDGDYYIIEKYSYITPLYELFLENISVLEANNRSVSDCYKHNILSLIIPDLAKNIIILSDIKLSNKEFSIVVINPFLATSRSSFNECGLGEYLSENPLRLTTSYYRLRSISSNIVFARKNGQPIFRSLNDKKTYWLNKNITRSSEVK